MSEHAGSMDAEVAGEVLTLLPERAAYWPRRRTLLVADPHWGKAASFRAGAIPVPRGTTTGGLDRLGAMVSQTGATRVVFLGDFLHAREGRAPETTRALATWRQAHSGLELVLVPGNHDRRAGLPDASLGVICLEAPMLDGPFVLAHHPVPSDLGYTLAGHLHPGVSLTGRGRLRERLPCFWFARDYGVLPAFGEFTGLAGVRPEAGDRVMAIAGSQVLEVALSVR
ncbi:MAG TPA: ligase-associated DNA damage response endonuclease PdeM [Gemmatimonadaceae bacterium]|nr:ligase-associated DNA damage response endonuclease PdeM [Gemmatimonadaceae bacterium]